MSKKESLLIDLQYFPCVNYAKVLFSSTHVEISLDEPYKKMTFRNRCVIIGSNGLINLSVPVEKGRNQRIPYAEVKIAYQENWQLQHWRTIVSCYNRSPYFEYYADKLAPLFQTQFEYLFQLNMAALEKITGILKAEMPEIVKGIPENTLDFRDRWLPKNYDNQFVIKYDQLFQDRIGFKPNVSILDLLFIEGPNCKNLLNQNGITLE
jgi:hypothetical protein